MDPILSKLNSAALTKVKTESPKVSLDQTGSSFQQIYNNKMQEAFFDKMEASLGFDKPSNMQALSAENIHVETANQELAQNSLDKPGNIVSLMNDRWNKLDTRLENIDKLTPQQLLGIQMETYRDMALIDVSAKVVEKSVQGIQTLEQMQA